MLSDAHIHLVDLEARDPSLTLGDFPAIVCAASHSETEFGRSQELIAILRARSEERAAGMGSIASFGIHPQWPVTHHAEFLASLAGSGRIAAIGEAGFDFFGDSPERRRTPENLAVQQEVFQLQLELAEKNDLPLLLHVRRAMDLLFPYSRRLARLPAVIFHSFSGTIGEGEAFISKGIEAYFSFGSALLNGHKRAMEACSRLPARRILSETDAPWQAPRGESWCRATHIVEVTARIAELRGMEPGEAGDLISANFGRAYPSSLRDPGRQGKPASPDGGDRAPGEVDRATRADRGDSPRAGPSQPRERTSP